MAMQAVLEKFSATISTLPEGERAALETLSNRMSSLYQMELNPADATTDRLSLAAIETDDSPSPDLIESDDTTTGAPKTDAPKKTPALDVIESD